MKFVAFILSALLISTGPVRASDDKPDISELVSQIEGAVGEIDRFLLELVDLRDGPTIGLNLLRVIHTYPFVDFLWLENRFRRLNTNVYLVAQPKVRLPADRCAVALWPSLPEPEFTLWIGVNGRDEMLKQLKEFGVDGEAQNRENLMRTGVMALVRGETPPLQ